MATFNPSTGTFTRQNTSQIIEQMEQEFQQAFNNPSFTVEDNENIGQLIKVHADRENRLQQTIEMIYDQTTFNGLEGSFLDNAYSLSGIFREPATAGSGDAVVQTDINASDTTPIATGTLFNGNNGVQYRSPATNLVSSRVTAYRLNATNMPLATYNFTITNRQTDEVFTQSITLAQGTNTARLAFLNSLLTFLQTVNTGETNLRVDVPTLTLYYGFNVGNDLVGLAQTVNFSVTPNLGNRYTLVECVATETGFNPLPARSIESMSILPTGYVSVTNISAFSSGTEIETDAAFIERASQLVDNPDASTRDAIVSGLLTRVQGVQTVRLNKAVTGGIVSVNPIVIGGEIQDIANELYRTQPINNIYTGTISATVATLDDDTETISFTRGEVRNLNIRIRYVSVTNTPLTTTEQTTVNNALVALSESWNLGQTIFNATLAQTVFSSLSSGRLSRLIVETKETTQPDSSYSANDYIAASNVLPDLLATDIIYQQEVV